MSKAMVNMSTEQLTVDSSGKSGSGRKNMILMIVLVLVVVLAIIFVALYASSNKKNGNLKVEIGKLNNELKDMKKGGSNKTTMAPTTVPTTPGTEVYHNIRLPKYIRPIHYVVALEIDMQLEFVDGTTNIKTEVSKRSKYIMVHAMKFNNVKVVVKKFDTQEKYPLEKEHGDNGGFLYKQNLYFVIEAHDYFEVGNYSLEFKFDYKLRKDLAGFYLSTYNNTKGQIVKVAATQFEPVDARSAFPCFDEPAMKATFDISMKRDKSYLALSNMPVIRTEADGDEVTNYFQTTPIVSTYLIVFVICDFEKRMVVANTKVPTNMTYYAPAAQIDQIGYAMEVGSKILPHFEEFYNVSYPLEKADMITIPSMSFGAMEHWGLVTYRLRALLFDQQNSAISDKYYISSIVAHELAHQWFGNIVTMDWWSDLWLNEGFASYVEYIGMDKVHPEWNVTDFQVISDVSRAMRLDSLISSHPIYIEVVKPADISEIFDGISYSKGGSILRMLDNFLGAEVFKKGLNMYLKKYSYRNAKTADLWASLSEASKLAGDNYNVTDVMNSWIFQMNFPELRIKSLNNGQFKVDQVRFLRDKNPDYSKEKFNSSYGYKWHIPFKYTTLKLDDGAKSVEVINATTLTWMKYENITVDTGSTDYLIKGNAGQYGFYRVNYDDAGWANMIKVLKYNHKVLAPTDRAGLMGDVFALANAGRLKEYTIALDVFDYIDADTDYLPWKAASDGINFIPGTLTSTRPAQKKITKYILGKVSALYEKYGFEDNDDFLERYLQVLIVSLACNNGHTACLGNATKLFKDWMENDKPVPGDFRSLVYYYGIKNSGIEAWDTMFKKFQNNKIASEKTKLLYGLAAIQEPWALERYMQYALDESKIRSQDTSYVFSYVANSNPIGRTVAWNFLKLNWDTIYEKFKDSFFTFRRIVSGVTSGFTTQYELDQMRAFIAEKKPENGQRIIQQSEETIKSTIEWLDKYEEPIDQWLSIRLFAVAA
ncbi:glutamyl aminopeptidase-like isoform X2 [Clytia hemisphaerica]|uniref:glutamyl aminopeptidase-like isoform X2 n=1 Tax=Clytia hemisphaerica TaxID=252671 RepID=UPI0034D4ACF9